MAAPIVPVLKSDKSSIRICGDFRVTVNKAVKLDSYPIPRVEDLFAKLSGGKRFTKLDLSQAYQQLELDEESKEYVVINTPRGLFRYNRLPFGISAAPGIFQRTLESLLQGIKNCVVYLDDILITGATNEKHLLTLDEVFSRPETAGLRLQRNKCKFLEPSVTYLGHLIDAEGLHPVPEKIKAIQDAPEPTDVSQLKSYLGLLSYYRKFMPNLSSVLAPLYNLLKADCHWRWHKEEQEALEASKKLLQSTNVLVHFNPDLELILSCDASSYGLGAVLSHQMPDGSERPIEFVSRTLSPSDKNFSQIEKEALALVFGVKRFHSYLFGRPFFIYTDHNPLVSLMSSEKPVSPHASARIQRWNLTLSMYQYTLYFKAAKDNTNADALSRLPLPSSPQETPEPQETVLLFDSLSAPLSAQNITDWTEKDPILSKVLFLYRMGGLVLLVTNSSHISEEN